MATALRVHACPQCQGPRVLWLADSSRDATVDYFRCGDCGHVWNQPKPGETGDARDVTERRSDP
jgi:predicted RNA-binding Zn-ribbon protein involved in translation (DUF1610 family)